MHSGPVCWRNLSWHHLVGTPLFLVCPLRRCKPYRGVSSLSRLVVSFWCWCSCSGEERDKNSSRSNKKNEKRRRMNAMLFFFGYWLFFFALSLFHRILFSCRFLSVAFILFLFSDPIMLSFCGWGSERGEMFLVLDVVLSLLSSLSLSHHILFLPSLFPHVFLVRVLCKKTTWTCSFWKQFAVIIFQKTPIRWFCPFLGSLYLLFIDSIVCVYVCLVQPFSFAIPSLVPLFRLFAICDLKLEMECRASSEENEKNKQSFFYLLFSSLLCLSSYFISRMWYPVVNISA